MQPFPKHLSAERFENEFPQLYSEIAASGEISEYPTFDDFKEKFPNLTNYSLGYIAGSYREGGVYAAWKRALTESKLTDRDPASGFGNLAPDLSEMANLDMRWGYYFTNKQIHSGGPNSQLAEEAMHTAMAANRATIDRDKARAKAEAGAKTEALARAEAEAEAGLNSGAKAWALARARAGTLAEAFAIASVEALALAGLLSY